MADKEKMWINIGIDFWGAHEQNNEGTHVDQWEKALLEIVMAGYETFNKSIVSLRQQGEPTYEEYQLDDLPDDVQADPGEVDADSSEYSRLAENYARADLVGQEIHVDLAKLVDNLLSEQQDDASLKQCAEQYLRPANCVFLEAPQVNKEIYGHLSAGQRATDEALRDAQADLLNLISPIINIMEINNNNSANLTSDSLCARTILKELGDAITFAGNVNLALIKRRKEALSPCLPAGVHKLCQKPDFSGKLLFGDKLQLQMKELNEQSKLSAKIAGPLPVPSKRGPQRQSPYSRGAVRGSKPLRNSDYGRRFRPYG